MLVIAWLLLPAGGFFFDLVGYFEQLMYLMLIAAIVLAERGRLIGAACLMAVTPCVHEIAVLTVLPVFALYVVRRFPQRAAFGALVPAVVMALVIFALGTSSAAAIARLDGALHGAGFPYRHDTLELFARTQRESWNLYSFPVIVARVAPTAIVVVLGFIALWRLEPDLWPVSARPEVARDQRALGLFVSCLAIAAPAFLAYAGWDGNRWVFLTLTHFFAVVWLSLRHELRAASIAVLAVVTLVLATLPIGYFEDRKARGLSYDDAVHLVHQLRDGSLFEEPTR
jgi:hypothetical protein